MRLILYSKPGCHLCEGLQEKLEKIHNLKFELEIRDITTCDSWFQQYQYEIPVLFIEQTTAELDRDTTVTPQATSSAIAASSPPPVLIPIPRPSPRASVPQLEQMLQKFLTNPAQ